MPRRPLPTAQKRLRGNPGRRKLNKSEPLFEGGTSPPKWMDGFAKTEWKRLGPRLSNNSMLTPADRTAFAAYTIAFSLARRSHEYLKGCEELHVETGTGSEKVRPEVTIMIQALDTCRKFLVEFGMTPAARSRVDLPQLGTGTKTRDFLFGGKSSGDDDQAAAAGAEVVPIRREE